MAVAVFDGHSGSQSAQYLSKELYKVFSEAIDDEVDVAEECAIEGMCIYGIPLSDSDWRCCA